MAQLTAPEIEALQAAGFEITTPEFWGYSPEQAEFMVCHKALWEIHNSSEFTEEIPASYSNGEVHLYNIDTEAHFAPGDIEAAKAAVTFIYQNNY